MHHGAVVRAGTWRRGAGGLSQGGGMRGLSEQVFELRHVIVDASAALQRTRRVWAAVVAGWTAKRKPKRAVGAAEGLRCFAAAGAPSCQAAGRGVWLPWVACCGLAGGGLSHGVRHLMDFYCGFGFLSPS